MKAWELAVSVPWAMRPEMVEALLEIAAREGGGPDALDSLVQGEFLHPGKDDEEYIRDAMELPAAG